jgi:hypothetical protein
VLGVVGVVVGACAYAACGVVIFTTILNENIVAMTMTTMDIMCLSVSFI